MRRDDIQVGTEYEVRGRSIPFKVTAVEHRRRKVYGSGRADAFVGHWTEGWVVDAVNRSGAETTFTPQQIVRPWAEAEAEAERAAAREAEADAADDAIIRDLRAIGLAAYPAHSRRTGRRLHGTFTITLDRDDVAELLARYRPEGTE